MAHPGSDALTHDRDGVAKAAREMIDRELTHGTSGNVSARVDEGFLITPSGVSRDGLHAGTIVRLRPDGEAERDAPRPSSEWRLHAAVYGARPEVRAVVHAHSPYATATACLRRDIPAFHYMVAVAGGKDVRCAPYATFGSAALAEAVLRALEDRRACLLANHGMVAVGATLREALDLAAEVEYLARLYCLALAAGEPVVLDEAEMERVRAGFGEYGQRRA